MSTADLNVESEQVAHARWEMGHQVFHLYLVGMNTLLAELLEGTGHSDARVGGILSDLAVLFEATSASMKYASSFESSVYEEMIRPAMSPPAMKPGFSGLLNVEHKRMMQALTCVPAWLKRRYGEQTSCWPPAVAEPWDALVRAEQNARRDHGYVCRKLVPHGPSLLRTHLAANPAALSN
jgi:hypothetical protein